MNERYLVHHGILGQRWGKRNGPPYPLDENDLSAAERKADTGEIKRDSGGSSHYQSGSGSSYKSMSNDELRRVTERMELENRYQRALQAQRGKSFFEKTVDTASKVASLTESTNKIIRFATGKDFGQLLSDRAKDGDNKTSSDDKNKLKSLTDQIENMKKESSKWKGESERYKNDANKWKTESEASKKSADMWREQSNRWAKEVDKYSQSSRSYKQLSDFWKSSADTLMSDYIKSTEQTDYWKSEFDKLSNRSSKSDNVNSYW